MSAIDAALSEIDRVAADGDLAPTPAALQEILAAIHDHGAVPTTTRDCTVVPADMDGAFPEDFYSTTIYPTDVRLDGRVIRATGQRMDAVLVVDGLPGEPQVACRLLRDLRVGERVVTGIEGVQTHPGRVERADETFGFMGAAVSSERRVELAVERVAWDMRRIRERGGRIVVVGGPVVVHTGGGPHLARLVAAGYVQALLGGNGLAAHDIEHPAGQLCAAAGGCCGAGCVSGLRVFGGRGGVGTPDR